MQPRLGATRTILQSTDVATKTGGYCVIHMLCGHLVFSYCYFAYYHLRLIGRIRHLLTRDALHAAVRCHMLRRLDYWNTLLGGLTNGQINRFQRAHNPAARLINRVRRRYHITPILHSLLWLLIRTRITSRCVLTY